LSNFPVQRLLWVVESLAGWVIESLAGSLGHLSLDLT
jgi:hypothetical protein